MYFCDCWRSADHPGFPEQKAGGKECTLYTAASEKERTQEIENMEEYMKTDEYVEDVARDKLGLVYEGETVFKPSN